jgi:predicted alpha/beta-fold hydrolase
VFTSATNVTYTAIVQDWDGFSEAAASTRAFSSLRAADQKAVLDFLKMQTIQGIVGEGGIGVPAEEVELPDLGLGG